MAKKIPLSHYVPKFSNKYWADDANFMSYLSSETSSTVTKLSQGKKQWGRKGGLYSWDVEKALDNGLETKVAPVYEKIVSYSEITESERLLWSQFLLSQLVRTPSYMEYEKTGAEIAGIRHAPKHDRVGCLDCLDLNFIANRNWLLLIVNEDDYLVRTDNPVFQSGFIELHDSYLIYPLTPTLCFVATPMDELWNPLEKNKNPTMGFEMAKG